MNIEIKNLSKSYGKTQVLRDISISAEGGRCIGIIGANGSGKSTLLSVLAGVLERDKGSFLFDGEDLFQKRKKHSQLVGYVPQGMPLIEELTGRDNLLLWYERNQLKQELESGILKLLGIESFIKMPVRKLSGGMKKRLAIGCAMAQHPPVLLLDEPTAALDIACKQSIWTYIEQFKKAGGLVFITTHEAQELAGCDQLYLLKNGVAEAYTYTGNFKDLADRL